MKNNPQLQAQLVDDIFSKYEKNPHADKSKAPQTSNKPIGHKMVLQSSQDQEDESFLKLLNQKALAMTDIKNTSNHKRVPQQTTTFQANVSVSMQIEPKGIKLLTFKQLPEQISFYLTEVYQFSTNKLFITGLMDNGQTINVVANQTYRELYFAFKKQEMQSEILTDQYINKGTKQIDRYLKALLPQLEQRQIIREVELKSYVFQLQGVQRKQRPYYKIRYPFRIDKVPQPDEEGEYFKYVFGTTYTPLELFILNTSIKGPCWVKMSKQMLKQNTANRQKGLCVNINEMYQSISPQKDKSKPPMMRVMSVSLKAAIPSHLSRKALFPTNRIDETHIYCISYTYCDEYLVQMKPVKYVTHQRTFYLKQFGQIKERNFQQCVDQKQMIALFLNDLNRYDPDVLVCHDQSKIFDVLIQRMAQIGDKNEKPRLGRLVQYQNINNSNQHQRITSALAGRLLVDTFTHSKDMIKSIDYELQPMSKHIKPEKVFVGMTESQVKNFLEEGKTMMVLKKVKDEAQITFALMNHLQVLQLTRNLSNICGNLWKRSLQNQRAERNQFLIMHECVRRDLIIPDKFKSMKYDEEGEQADKKKYMGGMVIDPKKGMYNDFIILLDFNSLYPSIIREYNICFSVLERPKMPLSKFYKSKKNNKLSKAEKNEINQKVRNEDEIQIVPPIRELCTKQKWGFLPCLIDGIVSQRNKCKKAMKTASIQKAIILDIQQKSYKIVANSIYGCLGFSISRFYSKHMAALITRMGRQALTRARDIVNSRGGVDVIYGDTDSLMIQPIALNKQTDKEKLFEIKSIADDLKKAINKEYNNLQIDIDGIFKPIILLMKKKYVANKLTNFQKIIAGIDQQPKFNLEFKGIEVVRRDGCEVARSSLKKILQILMNSKKTDPHQVYEQIYEYAKQLNGKLSILSYKDFLFSKQLNKKLKQYVNGQSIPHVKVANDRVRNGEKQQTLVNHTIYYLVCNARLESDDTLAKKCVDDRSYEKSQKYDQGKEKLQIDFTYYKTQILQPWMRIFIHLEEFNLDRLFQSFQVQDADRKKIKKQINGQKEVDNGLEDFLTNDMKEKSKRFNEEIGQITCTNCKNKLKYSSDGQIVIKCIHCPVENNKLMLNQLSNKISFYLKQKCSLYYNNKFKCECQKQYGLTMISRCCRVQMQKKTTIPFQAHTFAYLAKQLIEMTINKNKNVKYVNDKLRVINENILQKFLKNSDYQNITGIFNCFR